MGIFDNIKSSASNLGKSAETIINKEVKKETFTFRALPESVEEMKALPEAVLDNPFKTAALTVCALCALAASQEIGIEMLNFLKGPQPLSNMEISFLKDRVRDCKHYVPFSYFAGATPENDYTPAEPFTVTVESNPYSYVNNGYAKLFIKSGGADTPREVVLRRKGDGQWFLWEQMLMVGIRTPKSQNHWA